MTVTRPPSERKEGVIVDAETYALAEGEGGNHVSNGLTDTLFLDNLL